jgi:Methyltransferase domain
MVTKAEVLQSLLSLYKAPRYLEIGVAKGRTFHTVRAAKKVAVDPAFRFDQRQAKRAHPEAKYCEITSDVYFGEVVRPEDIFEVIYLDGLHTYEQTLRDFCNAIHHLSGRGVIVVDDVVPSGPSAAIPDLARFRALYRENPATSDAWMGDVYRLVYFIETFFQQYSYRTVSDNLGQLVVWKERRTKVPLRTVEWTAQARYEELPLNTESFHYACFAEILVEISGYVKRPARGKLPWL